MSTQCESCGMPIETGPYCQYCVDQDGKLQNFSTRFERMVAWQQRRGSSRSQAEIETVAYMANLPAWKSHPELQAKQEALRRPDQETEN
jgi:hypothetical protein